MAALTRGNCFFSLPDPRDLGGIGVRCAHDEEEHEQNRKQQDDKRREPIGKVRIPPDEDAGANHQVRDEHSRHALPIQKLIDQHGIARGRADAEHCEKYPARHEVAPGRQIMKERRSDLSYDGG